MAGRKSDFTLPTLDDLFSTQELRDDAKLSKIRDIPLELIDDFPDHPFKVRDDEDMIQLVESVKERGVITPATVRQKEDGRYELISGHRRKRACELAGFENLRCEVVDLDRDAATVLMVESNYQRSQILPSEKAFAYKMRLEAMKRQAGRPSKDNLVPVGLNFSRVELSEQSGESQTQIQRYIRLTNLVPELLDLVDEGKIKMRPAVELSSLFFSFLFIKLTRFADLSPGGRCPVPVNLILDEFNNIGRIGGAPDGSDFCRSLSVIRSRDIRVMLAVQSLGQLQNRYPNNLWSEIIGNCDIQLMLGCTDDVTADYISDRSGEMCIVVDSTMTVKKTVAVTQVIPQYRETQGQGKRKLLTPDEVLRLPHEQMLVIIRGQNLLLLNKFDYTRHPMSKEMVRASIMDYCPRTSYAPTPQTGSENEPDKKPQRESRGRKLSRSDTPPVEF